MIEREIIDNFDQFLNQDISVVASSLMRLGYMPTALLNGINRLQQMSTFSQDQCIRMLEAIAESGKHDDSTE